MAIGSKIDHTAHFRLQDLSYYVLIVLNRSLHLTSHHNLPWTVIRHPHEARD
jgi:hypothetical protein